MEITEVRVFPKSEEKLKAYVTITFDNCFVVRNLKVIQGQNGLFVAMPSRKMADGSHKDVAHPVNNETRQLIEQKVLKAYEEKMKELPAQVVPETSVVPETPVVPKTPVVTEFQA